MFFRRKKVKAVKQQQSQPKPEKETKTTTPESEDCEFCGLPAIALGLCPNCLSGHPPGHH